MHFSVVPVPSRLRGGEVSDAEERGKEVIRRWMRTRRIVALFLLCYSIYLGFPFLFSFRVFYPPSLSFLFLQSSYIRIFSSLFSFVWISFLVQWQCVVLMCNIFCWNTELTIRAIDDDKKYFKRILLLKNSPLDLNFFLSESHSFCIHFEKIKYFTHSFCIYVID